MTRYLCIHCWRLSAQRDLYYRPSAAGRAASKKLAARTVPEPVAVGALEPWMIDPNAEAVDDSSSPSVGEPDGLVPVRKARASWLREWFGDDEDDDRSLADETVLYCPCRAPLVPRHHAVHDEPLGLGISGPRSAGKTFLLLAMIRELQRHGLGDGMTLIGIDDTEKRFSDLSRRLFHQGERPAPTATDVPRGRYDESQDVSVESVPQSFCWTLLSGRTGPDRRSPRRRRSEAAPLFAVYDLAGETWGHRARERIERFDRYLGLLQSMIFVVDGSATARDLGLATEDAWAREQTLAPDDGATDREWLQRLIERMGERSREVDLALVVTKADLLWSRPQWAALRPESGGPRHDGSPAGASTSPEPADEVLETLLAESFRGPLLAAAREHFRKVRVFAASSLGFTPGTDDIADHRLQRRPEPVGVLQPMAWLLREALDRKGRR